MSSERLTCPQCGTQLITEAAHLKCPTCRTTVPIREGIPSFIDPSLYWGEIGHQDMCRTNQLALEKGWQTALRDVVSPLMPGSDKYIADDNRADWRLALPSMTDWNIIDLGAGWGPLSFALAKHCRKVVALEGVWERARFIQIRRSQSDISNLEVVHADATAPPFAKGTFDLAVVNGLLEWVPLWNTHGNPRDVQKDFLARIRQTLKPGGWLYVGIENRIGEMSFRGGKDHSGLKYTMLMPRALADFYVRQKQPSYRTNLRQGYRTYTYSYWGYNRLLRQAGFTPVDSYWVVPGYDLPRNMIPLNDERAAVFHLRPPGYRQTKGGLAYRIAKRLLAGIGASKALASHFCFIGRNI